MSGWCCPSCGQINNTADPRGNCKCEAERQRAIFARITASDEQCPYMENSAELDAVTEQLHIAIAALRKIYQPVATLVSECPPDMKVDGDGVRRLAADPTFYQNVAADALHAITQVKKAMEVENELRKM